MTQSDRQPPQFTKGQRLAAADLNALAESILSILQRRVGSGIGDPPVLIGKLDAALAKSPNWDTAPSTAIFTVWQKNGDGDLIETNRTETVVNRFKFLSWPADTIMEIRYTEGEWRPATADCEG